MKRKKFVSGVFAIVLAFTLAAGPAAQDFGLSQSVIPASAWWDGHEAKTIEELESPHYQAGLEHECYRYTVTDAEALAVTFSEDTSFNTRQEGVDEDNQDYLYIYDLADGNPYNDYFMGNDLAGKTVYVAGDTLEMMINTCTNKSYGFKVTDVRAIDMDDIPYSHVTATDASALETPHDNLRCAYRNYYYEYPYEEDKPYPAMLKMTFSDETVLEGDKDYIQIGERKYYGRQLAGQTVYVNNNCFNLIYSSETEGSYGFKVTDLQPVFFDYDDIESSYVDCTKLSELESEHNVPALTQKCYNYTYDGDGPFKLTFSKDTMLDLGYCDHILIDTDDTSSAYYYDELAGKTIAFGGNEVTIIVFSLTGQSYGFKVTDVQPATDDEVLIGTKVCSTLEEMQSMHPVPAGANKKYIYSVPDAEALKVTFSTDTAMPDDKSSYIYVSDSNSAELLGSDLAGRTMYIDSGTLAVNMYAETGGGYGFKVESVEAIDRQDVPYAPKTIDNEFLRVVTNEEGRYSLYTFDEDKNEIPISYSGGTSVTTFKLNGNLYNFTAEESHIDKEAEDPTIVSTMEIAEPDSADGKSVLVEQRISIVENPATGNSDVVRIAYTAVNNTGDKVKLGTRIMIDTMLGENDQAPFRVPGTGDVTTRTRYIGREVPASWQAFDDLNDPRGIAQGSFKREIENIPDEVHFTSWGSDVSWETGDDFETGENNGDSAVEIYWYEKDLADGSDITYSTYYGLSELVQNMEPPLTLSLSGDSFAAQVDYDEESSLPVYNQLLYTAYINNIDTVDVENAVVSIALPEGFTLDTADESNTASRSFARVAPGEIIQIDWKVNIDPTKVSPQDKLLVSVSSNADNDKEKTVSKYITIPGTLTEKTDISTVDVSGPTSYTYTGSAIVPDLVLRHGDTELVEGGSYTVEYFNNVNAGSMTATAVYTGIGMFTGTKTVEFSIAPKNVSDLVLTLDQNEFIYDGTEKKPEVTVRFRGSEEDLPLSLFTVEYYTDTASPGTKCVTVTANDPNFTGYKGCDYVVKGELSSASIAKLQHTYTGNAIEPPLTHVRDTAGNEVDPDYYTVEYSDNIKPGQAGIRVTLTEEGAARYIGSVNRTFNIIPAVGTLSLTSGIGSFKAEVTKDLNADGYEFVYSKDKNFPDDEKVTFTYTASKNSPSVNFSSKPEPGETWYVKYRAYVSIGGKKCGTFSEVKTVTVNGLGIKSASIAKLDHEYTGSAVKPEITSVKDDNGNKIDPKYYTVAYSDNTKVGKAKIKISLTAEGKKIYSGTFERYFNIVPAVGDLKLTTEKGAFKAEWQQIDFADGYEIVYSKDKTFDNVYTYEAKNGITSVNFSKNPKAGETWYVKYRAYKTINGEKHGLFSKVQSITVKDDIAKITGLSDTYVYNGKKITPNVTVTDRNGHKLTKDTDYTVSYSSNQYCGKATIKVTGKGNYQGTLTANFIIKPAKMNTPSCSLSNGKIIVKWQTQNGYNGGYEVAYGKNNKCNTKTTTVSDIKKSELTYSSITAPGTYYFRIRAFTKVDGVIYHGAWSSVRSYSYTVKVKKVNLKSTTIKYTKKAVKPVISSVVGGNGAKISAKNYTVTYYKSNKKTKTTSIKAKGTYYVCIKGINGYTGSVYKKITVK